jgi:hypothetical protein
MVIQQSNNLTIADISYMLNCHLRLSLAGRHFRKRLILARYLSSTISPQSAKHLHNIRLRRPLPTNHKHLLRLRTISYFNAAERQGYLSHDVALASVVEKTSVFKLVSRMRECVSDECPHM